MFQDGAFDGALEGIDGVVHAAAPIHPAIDHPDELIRPAVRSVTSILDAANKPWATVKRVIFVSSVSAITDMGRPAPGVWTDKDWNESAVVEVLEKGPAASLRATYPASKVLAERVAWDAYNAAKAEAEGGAGWDLVSLCPPWVFGYFLGAVEREELNFSVGTWYRTAVLEAPPPFPGLGNVYVEALSLRCGVWHRILTGWRSSKWTDVRDFAEATRLALTTPEAGGERFIISAGSSVWGQWGTPLFVLQWRFGLLMDRCLVFPPCLVNAARRVLGKSGDPRPEAPEAGLWVSEFDSQKSRDLLGVKYHSLEETTEFILDEFKKRGWV